MTLSEEVKAEASKGKGKGGPRQKTAAQLHLGLPASKG